MAVAGRAEERVGELEREHRRLVDDDEVVVVRERVVLVALEAALDRRVAERAVDRHRVVARQVAHAPRRLAGRRAEEHALARAARDVDERRAACASCRRPGSPVSRTSGRVRTSSTTAHCSSETCTSGRSGAAKSSTGGRARPLAERAREPALHLPQLARGTRGRPRARPPPRATSARTADSSGSSSPTSSSFAGAPPQLVERQERVAVRLRLLEHEAAGRRAAAADRPARCRATARCGRRS